MRVAVIGGGVIGLEVTRALLVEGHEVDCYDPVPGCGASTGRGRIFRCAHDSAPLVRLAQEARLRWREWERLAGRTFLAPTGFLLAGERHCRKYDRAMVEASAPREVLTAGQGQAKIPWLRIRSLLVG